MDLKNKSIAVITHRSHLPCIPGEDLKKFLLENGCAKLVFVTHPLLIQKESYQLTSEGVYYESQKAVKAFRATHWMLPEPLLYVKDLIYTIIWSLKTGQRYDIFFGINNLNALSGLILKIFGRTKRVVYYTIDLYPERFKSRVINFLYYQLDKFCVRHCDETWNVSPFMQKYRSKNGLIGEKYLRQFIVPIGKWLDAKITPLNKVKQNKIVYIGHLMPFRGIDLAIEAMPLIVKQIPDAILEIVGGGEQLESLKRLSAELDLEKHVKFHGFVENQKRATSLISDGSVGLAPYRPDDKSLVKNADPAKVKDYLALGLPVVITSIPSNSKEIEQARCGVVIDYTPESLASAVVTLLSDRKLWVQYRKNAIKYSHRFDWNSIFSSNIGRLI